MTFLENYHLIYKLKFREDLESREDWEEAISKGLGLLGINYEDRSEPFLGASGVTHPLLSLKP